MKRIAAVAAVLLALLSNGAAYALGPSGTLSSEPEDTGTVSVSAGLLHREVRLAPRKTGYSPITASQNHFYVQASDESYGWEWAARLGVADFNDGQQFDAGYRPFAGIGLKGHLYGDRATDFGIVASLRADIYSVYRVAGVAVAPGLLADVRVKDFWDAEAGLMAHRRFDRLTVYGGPVFEYVEGKVYRTTAVPVGFDATGDSYYKKQPNVGVAGGLSWKQNSKRFGVEAGASGGSYTVGFTAAVGF